VWIAEYWFDENVQNQSVDVIRIIQRSNPLAGKGYQEFYTILVDLKQDKDVIFNSMKKGTRNEIRRAAEKDGSIYECCSTDDETIDQFICYYNKFALKKRISKISSWILKEYAKMEALDISRVRAVDGNILNWNVFLKYNERARHLFGCSQFRESADISFSQLAGRATRYFHWQNMLKFKGQGMSIYDLGGWYQGNKDIAKLSINKFKECFGGVIVKNYKQEFGITPKGKLFVILLNVRNMLNELIKF